VKEAPVDLEQNLPEAEGNKANQNAAWVAAVFAGLAAVVAIYQVRVQKVQAQRQATFDHIRQVDDAIHALGGREARPAFQNILAFNRHDVDDLSLEARHYLVYLDSIELLGLAYKHDVVDRTLVLDHLSNQLGNPYTFSEAFIEELRKLRKDPTLYAHTIHLKTEARRLHR
jgi:hypothetical protein